MGIWGLEAEEGFLLRQEGLLGGGREGDVEARRARWSEAKRKEMAWLLSLFRQSIVSNGGFLVF